jgi:hypothetical protein
VRARNGATDARISSAVSRRTQGFASVSAAATYCRTACSSASVLRHTHAEGEGARRRREVEADYVAHLLHELRVARQLERVRAVRRQAEAASDAAHGRLAQADARRASAYAPVRAARGRLLRRHAARRTTRRAVTAGAVARWLLGRDAAVTSVR